MTLGTIIANLGDRGLVKEALAGLDDHRSVDQTWGRRGSWAGAVVEYATGPIARSSNWPVMQFGCP